MQMTERERRSHFKGMRATRPVWGHSGGWIRRIPALAAMVTAGISAPACAVGVENETTSESPIFGGVVDTDAPRHAAVVALRIGESAPYELCSGGVIAPNVVVTARHCVSRRTADTVICNSDGESGNGDHVGDDYPASAIRIYEGAAPDLRGAASAMAATIVHPEGYVLCNRDIALVVLDRPIEGIDPLRVRMSELVGAGEQLRSVGYGKNDQGLDMGTRIFRDGVAVLASGKGVSPSETALGEFEFEVGESICKGDSGGPAISEETGAIVGVVSRGGDCAADFGHVYTQTAGFGTLFQRAFELAGGMPLGESGEPISSYEAPSPAPDRGLGVSEEPDDSSDSRRRGGCSLAAGQGAGAPGGIAWLFAVGAALFAVRRRSRRG